MAGSSKPPQLYYVWDASADFTRKYGVGSACLFGPQTNDGMLVSLKWPGSAKRSRSALHVEILEDGPIWDCMSTGTDLIVSQSLKEFLEIRTGSDLVFLPLCLKNEDGTRTIGGYYGVVFKRVLKASTNYSQVDREMISSCGHSAVRVRDKKDDCWSRLLVDAELAEEMIANRFTGLGFKNCFSSKKPGWNGKKPRYFPEKDMMDHCLRDRPTLLIENIVTNAKSIQDGWRTLLKEAAAMQPADVWKTLEGLDVGDDLAYREIWFKMLLRTEPPPESVRAFWFGIFDRSGEKKGESLATLYACGSERYELENRYDFDWAVNPKWFPERRYASSDILDAISREANRMKSGELREALSYFLTLGYASLLVRFTVGAISKAKAPYLSRTKRPLAVGFDSGDGVFIGVVSHSGWKKK